MTDHDLILAAKNGGAERERLVERYMPLIGSVARHYRGAPGVERAELMQEGVVGLLLALERFDPDVGTPFWAYATWWVRRSMQQLVSELTRPVVLSDRAQRKLAAISRAQRRFAQQHRREPTVAELADATHLDLAQVELLLIAARRARGLDEPVGTGEGTGNTTLADTLADPQAEQAYDEVPADPAVARLPAALERLTSRERTIVRERYGFDGEECTLSELGDRLGVSAERVRQIERRSLEKLTRSIDALPPAA
jgi:RNA polymerase sigma factor (sigma-70 family)